MHAATNAPTTAPTKAPKKRVALLGELRRALPFLSPFRRPLLVVVALSLVTSCLTAAEPLAMKLIFDDVAAGERMIVVLRPIAALLILLTARELLMAVLEARVWKVRLGINHEMTRATVDRLHTLPLA